MCSRPSVGITQENVTPSCFFALWFCQIHIYGRYSQEPIKAFSRFRDAAYGATYRGDGRLLAAGSEDGGVCLLDIGGRAPLRQFEGHTK